MRIPVTELPQELPETGGLAWQLNIHEAACDASRLLVDTSQIGLAARLAGLSGVIVRGYQGETSEYTSVTSVTGIFNDSTASGTASAAATKAVTEKASLFDQDQKTPLTNYNWPVALVSLNRAELSSRIANQRRKEAEAERAWADELSRSLRRGIIKAAAANLTSMNRGNILLGKVAAMYDLTVFGALAIAMTDPSARIYIPAVFGGAHALAILASSNAHRGTVGETLIRNKRWSLFPFQLQPDRLALAAVAASVKPMVKTAKTSS